MFLLPRSSLVVVIAALSLVVTAACSDQRTPEGPKQVTPGDIGNIDVDATVELARKNVEKIRLTMQASRETRIEIVGGEPGEIPGMVNLKVRVQLEDRDGIRNLPVTSDLSHGIRGVIVPIGKIPRFRVELENVDLEDVPIRGKADAPVTIVEYSDFQCPYCRGSQRMIDRVLREYEGKVRLVFKHYPLEIHNWALSSSVLAECARRQNPEFFWKLHDYYMKGPLDISKENLLERTKDALKGEDVDIDKLTNCYLERETIDIVYADIKEGKTVGVKGTPVFLVNDIFVSGASQYEILNALILEELGQDPTGGGAG